MALADPGHVAYATTDWLVDEYVAVADLQVISALGIAAHPSLVAYGSSLSTEIRKRQQVSTIASLACRK